MTDETTPHPHLDAARAAMAAVALAVEWMAVDRFYADRPAPTARELALMFLAVRCAERPDRIRELMAHLPMTRLRELVPERTFSWTR